MKRLFILIAGGLLILVGIQAVTVASKSGDPRGKAIFMDEQCNLCHSIKSANIEAKMKSGKMAGSDLGGLAGKYEAAWIAKYLRKEADKEGKSHTRPFKGSDEELQALVDWLLEQKAE